MCNSRFSALKDRKSGKIETRNRLLSSWVTIAIVDAVVTVNCGVGGLLALTESCGFEGLLVGLPPIISTLSQQ